LAAVISLPTTVARRFVIELQGRKVQSVARKVPHNQDDESRFRPANTESTKTFLQQRLTGYTTWLSQSGGQSLPPPRLHYGGSSAR